MNMFNNDSDDDFCPYETLQNHDDWISQMAQHQEALAALLKDQTRQITQDHSLIKQMIRTIQMQQNQIIAMDDRIQQLEEKYEDKN
jgi:hypothetical protein